MSRKRRREENRTISHVSIKDIRWHRESSLRTVEIANGDFKRSPTVVSQITTVHLLIITFITATLKESYANYEADAKALGKALS